MAHDLAIPEKYGIFHTVGDTVGPGGWARAVRNIPVFYDLAQRMSRLCPNAWMINVTNPLTVLTRVPEKCFGIKCIGMCPGVEETAASMATLAGKKNARLDYTVTGIDHGSFFTKLYADGTDVLATLKEKGFCRSDGNIPQPVSIDDPLVGATSMRAGFALWREFGYLPAVGDRHTVENYPWFVTDPTGKLDFGIKRTSIAERQQWRDSQRQRLENYIADPSEKTLGAAGHGDDPIGLVIEALLGQKPFIWGSNYKNIGQISCVSTPSVVETRCLFDAAGVHPLASPMPEILQPIIIPTILRQENIIEITLHGTFNDLVPLIWSDPLCTRLNPTNCRQMVKELMTAQSKFIQNPRLLDF
jgi:alpha-galactosidase